MKRLITADDVAAEIVSLFMTDDDSSAKMFTDYITRLIKSYVAEQAVKEK